MELEEGSRVRDDDNEAKCFCLSNAIHGQNIDLPACVCVCVRHIFCQLAYRSDPSTEFYS